MTHPYSVNPAHLERRAIEQLMQGWRYAIDGADMLFLAAAAGIAASGQRIPADTVAKISEIRAQFGGGLWLEATSP